MLEKLERVSLLTTYLGKLRIIKNAIENQIFYAESISALLHHMICVTLIIKASKKLLFLFSNATLQHISKRVPRTKEELLDINGISK